MQDLTLRLTIKAMDPSGTLEKLPAMMTAIGKTGEQAMNRTRQGAAGLNTELKKTREFSKFAFDVLQAFLLYKGFVFLKTQVESFVRELVHLEHQLGIVQTQLNGLGGDYRPGIKSGIIRIARETGVAMTDLATAEYNVVSANIAVEESFRVLELSAKASVVGLTDVKTAFEAALTQANSFGVSASNIDRVFDKQFNLIKRGIFTYEQFATVSGTVATAFGEMGQDLDTANAALAAISQIFTGPQLERGATGLRNAIVKIGENREELEKLNVAVIDTEGNYRNFIDIIDDLNAALEGLSDSERQGIIRKIFEDERAVRGIEALLKRSEDMKQFYIEQKFAAGDLAEAFDTVNDSLLMQARIIRQDLTAATEPLFNSFSKILSVFIELKEVIPALSAALLLLIARSVVANNMMAQTTAIVGMRAGQPIYGKQLTKTGIGVAGTVGAVGALTAYEVGQAPGGGGWQGYAGAAATGAIGGSLLGPWGALIGGAINTGIYALGQHLEDEAPGIAKSFGEKFAEELKKNAGDISAAFIAAEKDEFLTRSNLDDVIEGLRGKGVSTAQDTGAGRFMVHDKTGQTRYFNTEAEAQAFAKSIGKKGNLIQREIISPSGNAVEQFISAYTESMREITETQNERLGRPLTDDQRMMILETAFAKSFGSVAPKYAQVAEDLLLAGKTASEARGLLETLLAPGQDSADAYDAFRKSIEPPANIPAKTSREIFDAMLEVLPSGSNLVDVLSRAADLVDKGIINWSSYTGDQLRIFGKQIKEWNGELMRVRFGEELVKLAEAAKLAPHLIENLEKWTVQLAANIQMSGHTIEEIAKDPTKFFELSGVIRDASQYEEPEEYEAFSVAQTSLADSLHEAAKQVREGFLSGVSYTADQLEMFGDELENFNRVLFKIGIVEELQRLGAYAGFGPESMAGAIKSLIEGIEIAGTSFQEFFTNPTKLADLLAELEFGDINVDQSTNNNFVIRISEGVSGDPANLARIADGIAVELNKRTRRALA